MSDRTTRRRGPILWLVGFLKADPAAAVLYAAMAIVLLPIVVGTAVWKCIEVISQYLGQF